MVSSLKNKKKKNIQEIENAFDRGESVLNMMKAGTEKAVTKTQKVNVNFPIWMIEAFDREVDRLAIDRQAVIKMLINDGLKQHGYETVV